MRNGLAERGGPKGWLTTVLDTDRGQKLLFSVGQCTTSHDEILDGTSKMKDSAPWEFECSVDCNAERAFAWAFWANVSNWECLEGNAVEWIKLDGPFAKGAQGKTKSPGQEARSWVISELDVERSATIKMPIDSALFFSRMTFESLPGDRTQISQRMSLEGEIPQSMLEGIRTFETTAPQGLAKLASAIEAEKKNVDASG